MENSKVITILNTVVERIIEPESVIYSGICSVLNVMRNDGIITDVEKSFVKNILYNNKPNHKQYTKFTEGPYWTGNTFWWVPMSAKSQTCEERVNYLLAVIHNIRYGKQ